MTRNTASRIVAAFDMSSFAARLYFALLLSCLPAVAQSADLYFEDVTDTAGIDFVGESWGASWGDLNSDPFPDLFTSNHRMRPSVFLNSGNGTFSDVAQQVDVDGKWRRAPYGDTHGATWADFDNDGDQDLLVATGGSDGTQFFVNSGGQLALRTQEYGITNTRGGGRLAVWFDYNNDRLLDIMLTNSASYAQIYRQDFSGFDSTSSTGAYCSENPQGQLSDLTGNGQMELVCIHESKFPDRIYDYRTLPFTRISNVMPQISPVIDSAIADFNGDLRPDILLVRGALRPSDALKVGTSAVEAHLDLGGRGERGFTFETTGVVTFDIDWISIFKGKADLDQIRIGSADWSPLATDFTLDPDDSNVWGMPDYNTAYDHGIYIGYFPDTGTWQVQLSAGDRWSTASIIVNSTSPTDNVQVKGRIAGEKPITPVLYMNSAAGFSDETASSGLDIPVQCISVAAADIDNDMDIDLYLACRRGAANTANILYLNDGSGNFSQVPGAGGAEGAKGAAVIEQAGASESVVAADYDVDGGMDFMVTNGLHMQPYHEGGPYNLFRNIKSNTNHWIEIDLQGITSNRDGIGASVFATAGGKTQLRELNGGYHRWSQHHKRLHFGLADNTTVSLRVEWPSGAVGYYNDVPADRLYRITENGGIEAVDVTPGTEDELACWKPTYDQSADNGLFIWKDCDAGTWQVRLLAGGVWTNTIGNVVADQAFTTVNPVSLEVEWGDVLDNAADPAIITYAMTVINSAIDGFDFTYPSGSSVCFGEGAPSGTTARLGLSAVEVSLPFNLDSLGPCSPGQSAVTIDDASVAEGGETAIFTLRLAPTSTDQVSVDYSTVDDSAIAGVDYLATSGGVTFEPGQSVQSVAVTILDDALAEGNEVFTVNLDNPVNVLLGNSGATGTIIDDDATVVCGAPVYDAGADREVFLWKDCVTGVWRTRFTAAVGGFQRYAGLLEADQEFVSVAGYSVESNDILDYTTDPASISYQMGMVSPWEDGFDFRYPDGASVCFGVDNPSGTSVLVGPERVPVATPFELETLQPCVINN